MLGLAGFLGSKQPGFLAHVAHEAAGERLAQLGGVVDLADAVADGFGDLVVGHTGGAVEDQRDLEAGADLLQDTLLDVRGADVEAVGGAHADGEGGAAGARDKLLGLVRVGVGTLALDGRAIVLLAADPAGLGLDGDVEQCRDLSHKGGQRDVVLESVVGAVDHDGGVAGVHGLDAVVEAVAVVQVDGHGYAGGVGDDLAHGSEVVEVGVLDGARGGLHDDRGLLVLGGADHGHDELEALGVEGTDGVVPGLGVEQHLLGSDEHVVLSIYSMPLQARPEWHAR